MLRSSFVQFDCVVAVVVVVVADFFVVVVFSSFFHFAYLSMHSGCIRNRQLTKTTTKSSKRNKINKVEPENAVCSQTFLYLYE